MISPPPLSSVHLRTFNAIFQHPASHNLEWRAVRSLLENLGEVHESSNGNLRATRNGEVLVLHPSRTKDIAGLDELMALRHFLERSQTPPAAPSSGEAETHWLLVIDRHEARIFRCEMLNAVPQRILTPEPADFFRQAQDSPEFSRGREKPAPNAFFPPVALALQGSGPVLVFGTGTGTSNEMDQFIAWAKRHDPALAARIIGSLVVDEGHLTEGQLLAKARGFYETSGEVL